MAAKKTEGKTTITIAPIKLQKARITAIIGANGAGKSTVSKLMRGLIRPLSGSAALGAVRRYGYQTHLKPCRRRYASARPFCLKV